MRIVGDLRWDELTSIPEWRERFSCLGNGINYSNPEPFVSGEVKRLSDIDCNYTVGGIKMNPDSVQFRENARSPSGYMASSVDFAIPDPSQRRAFLEAIREKYEMIEGDTVYHVSPPYTYTKYCSKYTCWSFLAGIWAKPTPYTISILDNVRTNSSEF
ncbi:hypothetical protein SynROS8604_03319 [Synechococcus sp. ROS8604]|nr:hypothetical protein SynROS8604_03319 [Synechococcus sp. ROS8604]